MHKIHRKHFLIGLFVGLTLLIIASFALWPASSSAPSPDFMNDKQLATCQEAIASYLGLTETGALVLATKERRGSRVVARDGQSFAVTDDYSPSRINLEINEGKVTKATCG